SILIASQSPQSILHGFRDGEYSEARPGRGEDALRTISVQRPEFTGGIGLPGLAALSDFVRAGGTLITLDSSTDLPIQFFPLSLRNVVRSGSGDAGGFYAPGSLLRVTVDNTHPLAFGMPAEAVVFSTGGHAFDITLAPSHNHPGREIRSVARFVEKNLLASGWSSGERQVLGKHVLVDARFGKGRVILFAFRPQFRGQTFGAFKFLLNAIYL
ncbi:MAG: hypothetical protein ACRD96_29125, partial [Bryobacteraceae bacterium]